MRSRTRKPWRLGSIGAFFVLFWQRGDSMVDLGKWSLRFFQEPPTWASFWFPGFRRHPKGGHAKKAHQTSFFVVCGMRQNPAKRDLKGSSMSCINRSASFALVSHVLVLDRQQWQNSLEPNSRLIILVGELQ